MKGKDGKFDLLTMIEMDQPEKWRENQKKGAWWSEPFDNPYQKLSKYQGLLYNLQFSRVTWRAWLDIGNLEKIPQVDLAL